MKKRAIAWVGVLATAVMLAGCGAQTARVLVEETFAQSDLFTQLCQAFEQETEYKISADKKNAEQVAKALADNKFDAALVVTEVATERGQERRCFMIRCCLWGRKKIYRACPIWMDIRLRTCSSI